MIDGNQRCRIRMMLLTSHVKFYSENSPLICTFHSNRVKAPLLPLSNYLRITLDIELILNSQTGKKRFEGIIINIPRLSPPQDSPEKKNDDNLHIDKDRENRIVNENHPRM